MSVRAMPSAPSARLEGVLDYRFTDKALLTMALTHRSFGAPHYERLEFLGDGVLDCVIAALLYRRFPDLPEGDLSRLRSHLVCQDTLRQLAQEIHLSAALRLGEGEIKSGGCQRPSILADVLEALFGAIYLDSGFEAATAVIERLFATQLATLVPGQSMKDAKTRLQEWLQGRHQALPKYILLETTGAAHAQTFHARCQIDSQDICAEGAGSSRRLAEQSAAAHVLRLLEGQGA
ncbi:MAG: ribonuclease III [Zoogloeaceae bacterium]|jgi:ribonuclease-3|nr:ribonuclease III [Zoogloeaceae bacterium]